MALDNIFMGKKVVQQAYLGNKLIYQTNGWSGIPEDYTKSDLPPVALNAFKNNTNITYLPDNTLAICYIGKSTIGSNTNVPNITKIDLNGNVIWNGSEMFTLTSRYEFAPYLRGYTEGDAGSGYVYTIGSDISKGSQPSGANTYWYGLFELSNKNGEINNYSALSASSSHNKTLQYPQSVCYDNDYIYVLFIDYNSNTYVSKFDYKFNEVIHLKPIHNYISTAIGCYPDSKYLYVNDVSYGKIYKLNKDTLERVDAFQPTNSVWDSAYINKLFVDNMENIYFFANRNFNGSYYNSYTFIKYSIANKSVVYKYTLPSNSCYIADATIDTNFNTYLYCYGDSSTWIYTIAKLDPSGKLLWKTSALDYGAFTNGIAVDKHGSVYYSRWNSTSGMQNISRFDSIRKPTK